MLYLIVALLLAHALIFGAAFVLVFRHLIDVEAALSAIMNACSEMNRKLNSPAQAPRAAQDAPRPRGRPPGSAKRVSPPTPAENDVETDPRQVAIPDAPQQ